MTNKDKIVNNLIGKDFKTTTIPSPKKKSKPNYSVKIAILLTLVAGGGFFYCGIKYREWKLTHEWQNPIVWIGLVKEVKSPLQVAEEKAKELQKTPEQIIDGYKLAPVLKSIYFIESTSGKNDSCKIEGKVNGYGYGQNSKANRCFESFESATERVNEWFTDRLAGNGNNIIEAVCFYNRGIQGMNVCDYSESFASVLLKFL